MSVFAHPHVSTSVVPQSYSRLELGRNKCESGLSAGLLAFKLKLYTEMMAKWDPIT